MEQDCTGKVFFGCFGGDRLAGRICGGVVTWIVTHHIGTPQRTNVWAGERHLQWVRQSNYICNCNSVRCTLLI